MDNPATRPASLHTDSALDSGLIDPALGDDQRLSRWMGWRLRLLVVAALLGCVALVMTARWLAAQPHLPADWRVGAQGEIELVRTDDAALKPLEGRALVGLLNDNGQVAIVDGLALQRSPRWIMGDTQRERHFDQHQQVAAVMGGSAVRVFFIGGRQVELALQPRGLLRLGSMFWVLSALSLTLYLVAMVVLLAKPSMRNLLYAVASLCQAGSLACMAVESTLQLGLPLGFLRWDMPLRLAFDLLTAAALVHAAYPAHQQPIGGRRIAWLGWGSALLLAALCAGGSLRGAWWWAQGGVTLLGLAALALLSWWYRREPHPFAVVMRRFGVMAISTWVLLTIAIAAGHRLPAVQQQMVNIGPAIWYVFFASLLLLVPFLSKSQQVMREFSLLAAVSTIATSLDLLFVAVFSLGQFASVTLALFLSLGIYAGARQWILNQLLGSNVLTTERMFEKLYRMAREVETHPERASDMLMQLLRELFDPMEAVVVEKATRSARVAGDGSTLVVPVPQLPGVGDGLPGSVVLRFAHRGRRLFTSEDARLAERILEQLRRAIAFDKAVEQGRSEERLRLAQDLHDDIGARLLTLMYKAQSPEMEEYVRHTLQDLKTLTRGLAAPNHPLSHAAAEWKADLTQRLTAAHIELGWNLTFDRDISLTVVQWSALTRVMRELVSNAIAHAKARRVDIEFHLLQDRLELTITDNGLGRDPQAWAHGLGLGGVRKRVKQLGGEVEWKEAGAVGIRCRVTIRQLSERR
jgi:signal transduction histidine kinase